MDLREILETLERRYSLKLPRKVTMADYGEDVGDLYVRFRYAEKTEGETSDDGLVILHYDEKEEIVGIEIMNIDALRSQA